VISCDYRLIAEQSLAIAPFTYHSYFRRLLKHLYLWNL